MDSEGNGQEVDMNKLGLVRNPCFLNFSLEMFRQACMLAGCDYLPPIPGLGIKKATQYMARFRNIDKIFKFLRLNPPKGIQLPLGYEEEFKQAELTFRFQRVFDHTSNKVVTLNPCEPSVAENPVIGPAIPDEIALKIAVGTIDPVSRIPFIKQTEYLYEKQQQSESGEQENNPPSSSPSLSLSLEIKPIQGHFQSPKPVSESLPIQKISINSYFSKNFFLKFHKVFNKINKKHFSISKLQLQWQPKNLLYHQDLNIQYLQKVSPNS